VPVWMTVEEAMKLTGLSPLRIMDLVKSLQVGFTRNGDGILLVDAEALETHVPAQGDPQTESGYVGAREAQEIIGLPYSVAAWWPYHHGNKHERKQDGRRWLYPVAWCEEQRELRAAGSRPTPELDHAPEPAEPPTNALGPKLSATAMRKLRHEVATFLDLHPNVSMQALSIASGLNSGFAGSITRKENQRTCHSTKAAAIRRAMREWPAEDGATEPDDDVDIAAIRLRWPELPAELRRMGRIAAGVFVKEARPESLDGDVLTLVFAPPFTFHYCQVTGPYKALVEQALERLYGRPLTVRTRFAEPAQDDVDPFAEPAQDVAVEQPEPIKRTLWQRLFGGR
jgi:hypothetical protein